jgi:hypothetical protein
VKSPEQTSWRERPPAKHLVRQARRDDAEARRTERAGRTDLEQLHLLMDRDAGFCKEAHKLRVKIDEELSAAEPLEQDYLEGKPEAVALIKKTRGARKRRTKPASLM